MNTCVFRDDLAALDVLFENFLCLFGGHLDIGDLLLVGLEDLDDRLELADADAAGLGDGDLVGEALLVDFLNESRKDGTSARGDAAGRHADDYSDVARAFAQNDLVLHLLFDGSEFS